MNMRDAVHHGLAIKRHASAAAVAHLMGLAEDETKAVLVTSAATGRAIEVNGAYALTPLARVALESRYGLYFQPLRQNADFEAAYQAFERVNHSLKKTITDWQTIEIGGNRVANDHTNKAHDAEIIDQLGRVHDQVEPILARLARGVPRLRIYEQKLERALEAAEDGEIEWVSDVRRDSYHTVWFELHEDLLRIMGRVREE
jgi:hypothetical protein